jgi:tripartite-type tricarboxylate transporter receptor subunit TctC
VFEDTFRNSPSRLAQEKPMGLRDLRNVVRVAMLLAGATLATVSTCRGDDTWPVRNVKIIVPFAAGSANDASARFYADGLTRRWGKPVIVENRPGADAVVGGGAFVNARDDHTLLSWAASVPGHGTDRLDS